MSDSLKADTFVVTFDAGHVVEFEVKSRDIAKLERAGVDMDETTGAVGTYALAFVVLERLKRTGKIDFDLPDSAEALEDIADIDVVGDGDVEGEGSGQAATPDKQPN